MSTTEATKTDLQALCETLAQGRPVDPDLARRIHDRSAKIREEVFQKHGPLNVTVDLIREVRDE
jgi:hypothetical protein